MLALLRPRGLPARREVRGEVHGIRALTIRGIVGDRTPVPLKLITLLLSRLQTVTLPTFWPYVAASPDRRTHSDALSAEIIMVSDSSSERKPSSPAPVWKKG